MGRFKHSVVGVVGLLACLLHHVCPLVLIPNIPYNLPTALSRLQFAAGTSYPSGGKTYLSTSSASSHGGSSYRPHVVRPAYVVGRSMVGYRQTPNVYTVSSRRPTIRSRISYTSVPTASTYSLINRSYRPRIVRQPTTHYVQTRRGSMINQRRRPTISIPTQVSRHRTTSRPVRTRIATQTIRSSTARQTPRGIPSFIPPSSVRAASAGSSRVGIAPKVPYVKKPYVNVPYVKKPTKKSLGPRDPLVKKYKKKSKSKSKKSSKSKAKRKAELKAKLKALRAKRKYNKQNTVG
ncbi:uncharacterized protein LOC110447905 [Mizuhopecten yessoensis]|uniref:uncharacterized protein LOC110447905 n=1 Tax=Mizuhopecten yessoensis TaxID=6573 RepID=UPI000B45AD85|nr:uncharacterized protein LOC110447905 [Mizuhopecten yessoensis]